MKVFIVSQGQDIGGQGARTAIAFRKHTGWTVRSMHVGRTYIQYPYDLGWDFQKAKKLYHEADVIHHQNRLYGYAMYERGQRKPSVVTHHGPPLRGDADRINLEARSIGADQTVSTVDLLADAPHAAWTPNFYDIQNLRKDNPRRHKNKILRIGHGPTVREAKGTDKILRALDALARRYDIEVDLQENLPWNRSLAAKAQCDIFVDQVTLGYGLSTIECMALGVPVVSGWDDDADLALFKRETQCTETPFLHAKWRGLEWSIERLIKSAELRQEYVDRGLDFVRRFHDEEQGIAQWKAIYAAAPASQGVEKLELYSEQPKAEVLRKWATA